jgi:taurine dioxygenase
MTDLTIRPLADHLSFGARVSGVTIDNVFDEAVRAKLRQLFEDRGMIVFEDIEQTNKMHVELSKVFGPLKDHPTKSTSRTAEDEAHGVIDMHYKPREGEIEKGDGLVEIDGKLLARFSPWHFDHCYNNELNYAGVLRCPINAPEGGRTGFMDGIEAYRQFPAELRAKIEGRNVIYTLDTRLSKMRFGVNFRHVSENAAPSGRGRAAKKCSTSRRGWRWGSSTTRRPRATRCSTRRATRSTGSARGRAPTGTSGSPPTW